MSWLLCYTYLRYFLMLIQIRLNRTPQMVSGAALEACPILWRLLIAFNIIKCFFENVAHVSHWPKFMKLDFNRWWCVFSHVLFWCVSNSFYIKFHWCRSIEMGLLSFCVIQFWYINQASRFDTIKTWPKLGIHARRTYKENFWIKIEIKLCENFNSDDLCGRNGNRETKKGRIDREKTVDEMFYLCQKSANVINLLHSFICVRILLG